MSNSKRDLWNEFSEDENAGIKRPDEAIEQTQPPTNDGSEWVGKYDRRSTPRDEESDPGDDESA